MPRSVFRRWRADCPGQRWAAPAAVIALVWMLGPGCVAPGGSVRLGEAAASAHAVALANQKALELYRVSPFTVTRGDLEYEGGRWQWQSLMPVGKSELEGRVTFLANGSEPAVTVRMWALPLFGPDLQPRETTWPTRAEPARPAEKFRR